MANDRSNPNLFNPVFAWADLGMRAAEMTLASSQNINDVVDRLTRAGASADTLETGSTRSAATQVTMGPFENLQRSVFELVTEGWLRWMSALGTLASMPAGVGLARTVAKRDNLLEAVRTLAARPRQSARARGGLRASERHAAAWRISYRSRLNVSKCTRADDWLHRVALSLMRVKKPCETPT